MKFFLFPGITFLTFTSILIMAGAAVIPLAYMIKRIFADSYAEGVVSEFRKETHEDEHFPESSYEIVPYVTFMTKIGQTYTIKAPFDYTHYKKIGDVVKVYYGSADPQNAKAQLLTPTFLSTFIIGLSLFLLSCFGPSLAEHFKLGALSNVFDALIRLPHATTANLLIRIIFMVFAAIGFIICPSVLITLATKSYYSKIQQNLRPVEVAGTVTNVESKTTIFGSGKDRRKSTTYATIASFAAEDGKMYKIAHIGLLASVGEEVKIRYNPLSPQDAKIEYEAPLAYSIILLLITPVLILPAVFIANNGFTLLKP